MADLSKMITAMEVAFDKMKVTFLAKIAVKAVSALMADDAKILGNKTATILVKEQTDDAAEHIADRENPHGLTLAEFDGVPVATVSARTKGVIPKGTLPISRFGQLAGTTGQAVISLSKLIFAAQNVIMSGNPFAMPLTELDFPTLFPGTWQNKTYFIYLTWNGTTASYLASLTELVETPSRMYIGTATTGSNGMASHAIIQVTRIDNYRISTTPVGSAIPATTGLPTSTATLPTSWFAP